MLRSPASTQYMTGGGWWYLSCPHCYKRVRSYNDIYYFYTHGDLIVNPFPTFVTTTSIIGLLSMFIISSLSLQIGERGRKKARRKTTHDPYNQCLSFDLHYTMEDETGGTTMVIDDSVVEIL